MQKSLWITTNNYHMTEWTQVPPIFQCPCLFCSQPVFNQIGFLSSMWHFSYQHKSYSGQTWTMNYGEEGYVAEAVLCEEMLKRFFFRRMITWPQFWANIRKLVGGQPTKKWSLQYLRYLCTRSPSQCTGGLYKAAHRMLTPESQRGLGSPLGNEQHDFSLLSCWIAARKVFRRKCKARKVRRSKAWLCNKSDKRCRFENPHVPKPGDLGESHTHRGTATVVYLIWSDHTWGGATLLCPT